MKTRHYSSGPASKGSAVLAFCLSTAVLAGIANSADAAVIKAEAQISGVSVGHGTYAYTLTLHNTAASTASIALFWFAWEAGQADFMTSQPTSINTPAGWSATVDGGGDGDGYSIQFVTFTSPLKPGSSVTFTFNSADSPKMMAGPATLYPEYPTLTSQVYSNPAASGVQDVFVAKLVPANLGVLAGEMSGANLVLTWSSASNVVLQQNSSLTPTNWSTIPGTLGMGSFTVTNVPSQAPVFYRLATQ